MFAVRNMLPLLLVALLCSFSFGDTFRTVIQAGGGDYTTIQAALTASGPSDVNGTIEVQDNATYPENLLFPDVNGLILQSGSSFRPTITVSGTDANTHYIHMMAVGQTIQGFDINFSGSAYTPPVGQDSNSVMILSTGGASTVRDCNIVGTTDGWVRGIAAVATIEDVNVSNCRIGVLCDINEVAAGFRYSISGCHIYNHVVRGVIFADCNAVMDNCLVERCGETTIPPGPGGNVIITDGNSTTPAGTTNVLITNSIIREAIYGRNVSMETIGTATIEDSIIMNALGTATHSDEILQYRGTLNLNRCIIKAGQRCGVNMAPPGSGEKGSVCNIDHCDFYDTNATTQWALTTSDACAVLTVKNSILTGENGYLRNFGTFTSNWNDNFCTNPIGLSGSVVPGPNDIVPGVDPFYIQTDDANLDTFFALQPYSPVVNADEDGNYMGSQGWMTGYERWPGSLLDGVYGSDFNDFAVLASHWLDSNIIPGIPQVVLDTFEPYTATGAPGVVGTLLGPRVAGKPNAWRVAPWTYTITPPWVRGSSTLSLLITSDPNDSNDPNDPNSGWKAMRWEYDVNTIPHEPNGAGGPGVGFTEILVVLPAEVNFVPYNELRVMLKRHAGNSPDTETYMYAKFLNNIYGIWPGYTGIDNTGPDKWDVANQVIGGQTATPAGVYTNWTINFDNLAGWLYGHTDLKHVGAIIFGVRTQPEGPYGWGTGTIDVDDIRLVDRPGCSGNPVGDLADESTPQDCEVTFEDVRIFTDYWLEGK